MQPLRPQYGRWPCSPHPETRLDGSWGEESNERKANVGRCVNVLPGPPPQKVCEGRAGGRLTCGPCMYLAGLPWRLSPPRQK